MEPVKPNTKYADFIDQALEGLEQAIKTRSQAGKDEPAIMKLLRKLIEEDDKDEKSE